MHLQQFTDVAAFSTQVGAFLEAHEAEHCVLLGNLATRIRLGSINPIYCAAVMEGDVVLGVALMTPPYHLLLSRDMPLDALPLIAQDLLQGAWLVASVVAETAASLGFAETWQQMTGHGFTLSMGERLFQLDQVIPVTGVAGQMRAITAADRPLLQRWLADFEREALHSSLMLQQIDERIDRYLLHTVSGLYVWEVAGTLVAMAAHSGPTPHGMRIGPVYTPPALRGHGYASALVAALSQMLLDSGRQFCFLFTDLANPTSNHIYQTVGYRPISDVAVYHFT